MGRTQTEYPLSNQALLNSSNHSTKNLYEALIRHTGDAVFVLNADSGALLGANDAFCDLLAYTPEEITRLSIFDIVDEDAEVVQRHLRAVVASGFGRFSHRRFLRSDRRVLEVEITATAMRAESCTVVGVIARDISARRVAERQQEALQDAVTNAAAQWRHTFDAIPSPILGVDSEFRIVRLNGAAADYLLSDIQSLLNTPLPSSPDEPWFAVREQVRSAFRDRHLYQCRTCDNRGRHLQITATPGNGFVVVLLDDFSALHQLQESVRRAEIMSAMGSLVAGVAHEVRNPLFTISALLETFELSFCFTAEQLPYIQHLRAELNRLNRLMTDLLAYGKAAITEKSPADLVLLVHTAIDLNKQQARDRQLNVTFEAPAPIIVSVDPPRIVDAIRNLLENAVYHSATGSAIEICVQRTADTVSLSVRDHGNGFNPDALLHGFDPFYSRRPGGTGLGLPLAQRVIAEHGGEIRLGNHPDGGGVVSFSLPATAAGRS
ncbi:MAG: hypothetical protein NVS9B15_04210 [Acidobacteriaceae bacterium]